MRLTTALIFALFAWFAIDCHAGLGSIQPLIYQDQAVCTAFSINEKRHLWMTADHCAFDVVSIAGGWGSEYWHDPAVDLAIIEVPDVSVKALRARRSVSKVGDRVTISGYPFSNTIPLTTFGYVSAFGIEITDQDGDTSVKDIFNISSCRGNSGAPILDKHGDVVSVVTTGFGSTCAGIVAGVPWTTVAKVMNEYR